LRRRRLRLDRDDGCGRRHGAAARTGAGSAGAGADTCIGASDAVVPAFTDSVLTSTGRIGSVEPAAVRGCAAAAIDSVLVVAGSVCAAGAEFSRTGKLTALATANRASALGSAFASVLFASVLAATFGSGFASTLAATFGSGAVSTLATVLGSGSCLRRRRAFRHHRRGALDRGLGNLVADQIPHLCVAAAGAAAAHHHGDEVAIAAMNRRHQVEPRCVDVTGLDAVDAFDAAQQMVVVADRLAAEVKVRIEKYL
jgi:hypothetical protein